MAAKPVTMVSEVLDQLGYLRCQVELLVALMGDPAITSVPGLTLAYLSVALEAVTSKLAKQEAALDDALVAAGGTGASKKPDK